MGTNLHMFYCEVSDSHHQGKGGGNPEEGEFIDVVHFPVDDIDSIIYGNTYNVPSSLLFALIWFQKNKMT